MSSAPDVLVIGVGNAVRGDDAAGLLAARRLGGVEHEGDPLALLELWHGAGVAVVIDAVRSGAEPGTLHRFDAGAAPLPAGLRSSTSTHAVGLAEAIELARALGRLPEQLVVYGIEGERFDAGAEVTLPVRDAVDRLARLQAPAPVNSSWFSSERWIDAIARNASRR